MPFGYPNIKRPLRERFHHISHGTARRHGRSNSHDPFILFGQLNKGMSENILIKLGLIQFMNNDTFSCFLIEQPRSMPFRC